MTENEAKEIINNFPKWNSDDQWLEETKMCDLCETVIFNLQEIQQYRTIGTVEECRKAMQKQKPKQPVKYDSCGNKCASDRCPNCFEIVNGKHCENCGQAIS